MPTYDQDASIVSHASRRRPRRRRQVAQKSDVPRQNPWELFQRAPGFICVLRGPNHLFEFANDAYRRLVGGRDVIGKPVLECLPEIAGQAFPELLDQVYRSGETYTGFDTPIKLQRLPDGAVEQRFLDFVYQPINGPQGQTTGIFVEGMDVTERVRAQTAALESKTQIDRLRRFYETVLTNTPDHAYIFGLDHRFIYASVQLLKALGKTAEGAVGKTFLELGYPDWHAAKHDRELDQVIATKQLVHGTVPFTGPLGRRVYDYIFTPVLDAAGNVEAIAGTTRDVTDVRQAKKATTRLASIVASSDDAIVSKDLQGIILTWNKSAERMFGYSAGEAVGRPITELIIPVDRLEEEAEILRRLARGETIDHYETIRRRKDGSALDVSVTISPLREGGRIIGGSKIARDITQRKRHERNRELLIQELNHRVKNTLVTVQALAMHSLRTADLATPQYPEFEARLLALSEAHNVLTRKGWVFAELGEIVTSAIQPYSTPDRAFRFEITGDPLRLQSHAGVALAMALHELATNAVKYGALSGEHGQVGIRWWHARNAGDERALFCLRWTEHSGPRVTPPKRRGFGLRLIEQGLAQDLGGSVELRFEPSGLVCTICAPLEGIATKDEG